MENQRRRQQRVDNRQHWRDEGKDYYRGVGNSTGRTKDWIWRGEDKAIWRISVHKDYYDSKPKDDIRKGCKVEESNKKCRQSLNGKMGEDRDDGRKGEALTEMQKSSSTKRTEAIEIDESWTKFCLVGVLKDPNG
ncbi:hypothetical protein U1Q18_035225, partial [Sarracenia purpurea var. burkii]